MVVVVGYRRAPGDFAWWGPFPLQPPPKLTHHPPPSPLPSTFAPSPGGFLHYGSLTHRRDDPGNLIMHTTKVCPPTATATRTTATATLNPTSSRPPLMHLHTEDRPNKVINQRPIFKWFAGRLKPLHTLPQVNSPTCCGARYPFSSADTGAASNRTPRYKYICRFIALPRDELPQYINIHMLISHMP